VSEVLQFSNSIIIIPLLTGGVTPGGVTVTPWASLRFCLSQVGHTSGFTAAAQFPNVGTSQRSYARGVPPPPPRARATVRMVYVTR
jgi:hypothetical protein